MSTTTIKHRAHLDGLLEELNDRGHGEASAFDGAPYLLAAYEDGEAAVWDAFGTHPYSTEGDPAGLARQLTLEDEVAEGHEELEGWGFTSDARLLAVDTKHEHPGLDHLRYPLTVMHADLPGDTPYLDEGEADRG